MDLDSLEDDVRSWMKETPIIAGQLLTVFARLRAAEAVCECFQASDAAHMILITSGTDACNFWHAWLKTRGEPASDGETP